MFGLFFYHFFLSCSEIKHNKIGPKKGLSFLLCWVVKTMALPNNETLKDHRFRGAWRPSQEAERLWERNVDSFFTPSNGVRLHMKLFKVGRK